MKKAAPLLVLVILAAIAGFYFLNNKPQISSVTDSRAQFEKKKLALASQPDWVKNLDVAIKSGVNAKNGLKTVTVTVSGLSTSLVSAIEYAAQYETTNVGLKGTASLSPIALSGATQLTRTFDLGTCSTKSCVRHDGVKSIDLELTLTGSTGGPYYWAKTLELK